ncbi:MAG: hypothetical protein N4J56_006927 [Chroococcidiopsis sp. SAG 2025]|nr:hypothetical protein [Chroococcidiopsis sp. SAG 2025]
MELFLIGLLSISIYYITGMYPGERTMSIDEMTGIQATERIEKDLPMRPGKVGRREFEYIPHGTQSLIAVLQCLPLVKLSNQVVEIQEQK